MKRRAFLHSVLAAAATASATMPKLVSAGEPDGPARDLYELRTYSLKAAKQPLLDGYLRDALLPALARMGMAKVGVFYEPLPPENLLVHVLMILASADQVVTLPGRLNGDGEYRKTASDFLAARASDPIYDRIESSLLLALAGLPHWKTTDTALPRLMNLRTYESHNERAALKKIEMFNTGELSVFERARMPVVFCAETIVGPRMPNLTYMLAFSDEADRKAGWSRFGKDDPDWKRFRSMHEYDDKEIVSKITNRILTPTSYSGI